VADHRLVIVGFKPFREGVRVSEGDPHMFPGMRVGDFVVNRDRLVRHGLVINFLASPACPQASAIGIEDVVFLEFVAPRAREEFNDLERLWIKRLCFTEPSR
jgi:hypothetical protein